MTDNAPIFRERAIARAEEFIRNHVPVHTRAQYEALLATNTDLALELIAIWRDHEELKEAYYRLQIEAGEGVAPLPAVTARCEMEEHPYERATVIRLNWRLSNNAASIAFDQRHLEKLRGLPDAMPELHRAFERFFHERYVPRLWDETHRTLFDTAAKALVA